MADSRAFELACDELEQHSSLSRLEARGTIRLTLKEAGLEASTVTAAQLAVAVEKLLPPQLESRGVTNGVEIGVTLSRTLASLVSQARTSTPEAVFSRLAKTRS